MTLKNNLMHQPLLSLVIGLSFVAGSLVPASAEIQDQWRPVDRTLSDYVADGYQIQTILLDRVTPVSVEATLYFLRKENVLVRCSETSTRNAGMITNLTVTCAELAKPVVK